MTKKAPYPPHINPAKVPTGMYWHPNGRGRWITVYRVAGKQKTKTLAGPAASLADLHQAMEAFKGTATGTLAHLVEQFEHSQEFRELAPATQRDYEFSAKGLKATKTRTGPLGEQPLAGWSRPMCQRLIDKIAKDRGPSAANHALRYLKRLFRWGMNRGHCADNPAKGIEAAKERKRRRLPTQASYNAALAYAMECGSKTPHTKGSCPGYLWAVIELAYLLRLRGIEVLDLTDAAALENGIHVIRRKGSRGNITEWSPRLRAAWDYLSERRQTIHQKRKTAVRMHAHQRHLVVAEDGNPLARDSLSSAWDRFIKGAIKAGKIAAEDRFALHDLKRKGVTDTTGTWADKSQASGHKSDTMRDVYDHQLPVVKPSGE